MKEEIVEFNKQFGLNTEFIQDPEIQGYALGNTIYLNEKASDLEKVNKHELLHFFEEDETFLVIKEDLLNQLGESMEYLRKDYYLRYYGLYSEEEIKSGILDTEIVIDILSNNFEMDYEQGLKLGDKLLIKMSKNLENKRYLNLSLNNQISQMNLSKWEKLFVSNFYDGKDHILPPKENREKQIREDIQKELERLVNLSKKDFRISPSSKEILREYESELKALESRGEDTLYLRTSKAHSLEELASKFSSTLYEEYKHITDFIRNTDYEDSFKVLMLRETLSKTYKIDTNDGKKTIVKKRKLDESISSHMTLNETVLEVIYKNVDDYSNFANLYFAGLEIFNQKIVETSNISLENVDTYGMGHWIKFEGKTSNEEKYIENANNLSALVKDTPWCTKSLASSQLGEGDFYVFVDNSKKPHIAVKMNGNEIDEVRGILNGNAQELEEEYRKVALSFLDNNKEIKNGKEWMEKEEWNKRLIQYSKEIEREKFQKEEIPQLMYDLFEFRDFKAHFETNTNKEKLRELLPRITPQLAEYYNCREEEIGLGDIDFGAGKYSDLEVCPYKIILGDANFEESQIQDLGDLIIIGGAANFQESLIQDLGNLTIIGKNANFEESQVQNIGNLTRIGGFANFGGSQIQNLGNLTAIGGGATFMSSKIQDLGKLTTIGGSADFSYSQVQNLKELISVGGSFKSSIILQDLGKLTTIGGDAVFIGSQIQDLGNLTTIRGDADFMDSQIQDLGNLTTIGGDASFGNSKVKNLGNLTTIGRIANFSNSEVQNLGNLTTIGEDANFMNSKIQDLGNLTTVGRDAYFFHSQIQDLGKIEKIGREVLFSTKKQQELYEMEFDEKGNRKLEYLEIGKTR